MVPTLPHILLLWLLVVCLCIMSHQKLWSYGDKATIQSHPQTREAEDQTRDILFTRYVVCPLHHNSSYGYLLPQILLLWLLITSDIVTMVTNYLRYCYYGNQLPQILLLWLLFTSDFSILFCSSILVIISVMLVSRTIPPITSSAKIYCT